MEIVPFTTMGVLAFGDSRAVAREKLGSDFSTFEKVVGAGETDSFDDLGMHLYYSDTGQLEFVEAFDYYSDTGQLEFVEAFDPAEVVFRGVGFLGSDLNSVIPSMGLLAFTPTEDDIGVKFESAGIALTAPAGVVEGVAAYRKGYYDS